MPAVTVCAVIVPTGTGGRLSNTVTAMGCWGLVAAPSLAVTLTVALPAATPVMVTIDPVTLTVALLTAEEVAA